MRANVLDAIESAISAAAGQGGEPRSQSATAGELCACPVAAREQLGAALRDAGYPDALRSPQALGMALRQLMQSADGPRRLCRTPSGRWYLRHGQAVAA